MSVKMFFKAVHEEKRPVKASVRTTQTGSVVPVQAHQANRRIADQDAPKPRQMNLFGQQDLFQRKPELAEAKRTIEDKPEPKSIGKTRSGKDIYDVFDHEKHKNFTQQDHMDASLYHSHLLLDLIKRGQGESEKGKLHRATAEKHYQKTNGSQDDYDKANIHVFNHKNKSNKITVERQNFLNKQYYVARRGYDSEKSFISPDDAVKKLKERYDTESKMKINSAEAIGEMMNQYDSKKAEWIKQKGSDKGFDDWFTEQAYGKETAAKIKNAKPASPVEQAKATIEEEKKPMWNQVQNKIEFVNIGSKIKVRWDGMGYGEITDKRKEGFDTGKRYETTDGKQFDGLREAKAHELDSETKHRLADDGFILPDHDEVDIDDLGKMGKVKITDVGEENIYFKKDGKYYYSKVNDTEKYKAGDHDFSKADSAKTEYAGLPKNLEDMTGEQLRSVVDMLAKKPLKELRKRQDLVQQQIKAEMEKPDKESIRTIRNLHMMEHHLMMAVDKKEFPEDRPAKKPKKTRRGFDETSHYRSE
jgi:hypothetical protein